MEEVPVKLSQHLRDLVRELRMWQRAVYQDLRLGQSRFEILESTTTTAVITSTLSTTDTGVMTITYSAGGAKLWTTVSGKALFTTLNSA